MSTYLYPPVSATLAGGATEAKQDDIIALLTTIDVDTSSIALSNTSIDGKITACNTGNVTIAASALPAGASTSALQTAANALLTTIDVDTSSIALSNTSLDTKLPAQGAALIAASIPVNIASDQTVPISAAALPLPSGAATSANQTTGNASLATIAGDTTSIDGKITACNTGAVVISSALPAGSNNIGDVDVASSALPSGASTSALQTTGNSSLSNIESDINDLNARLAGNLVPETFDYLALTYVAAGNGTGEIETVVYKTGGAGGSTVATLTLAYDGSDRLNAVTRT